MVGISKIAVVIYSESFASSAWCLRELELILQRREEKKMFMIPIFYNIDVHELQHVSGKTRECLDKLIPKYGETIVQKWKDAVTTLGEVSGLSYKITQGRYEYDFIVEVITKTKGILEELEETLESNIVKPYYRGLTTDHDVFISFMGKDTRYSLISHLYNALILKNKKIFMDDQDHLKDDIVFEVIQRSKMAVVVFSENYASSKWRLRELVKIFQCRNTIGQVVLPIFYEVIPSDLINQAAKGSRIACHLEKHVRDEKLDTIQSWSNAITDLGNTIGWRYYSTGHSEKELADFIQGLVEEISTILNRFDDEKKESPRNEQAYVSSAKEENTQVLALQTYPETSTSGEESQMRSSTGDASSVSMGNSSISNEVAGAAVIEDDGAYNDQMDIAAANLDKLELIMTSNSNDHQPTDIQSVEKLELVEELSSKDERQADECLKAEINDECSSSDHKSIDKDLEVRQEHIEEVYTIFPSAYFQISEEITGELLNIKPSSLIFYIKRWQPSSTCIILSNNTDNSVAFKIQTTREQLQKYTVLPYEGFVLPRSTCQVIVTVQAQSVMKCSDKLSIHSVIAKNNSSTKFDFSNMMGFEYMMEVLYYDPPERSYSVPNHLHHLISNGFVLGSEEVLSIDTHSTKPWILLCLSNGSVCIWNNETRAKEKSFKLYASPGRSTKFIPTKNWIVVGFDDGIVRVFDYNTLKELKQFKAHKEYINCMAIHPNFPYVFTASEDKLIKFWNWEDDWECGMTFEGHSGGVKQVAFDPKDPKSFASLSCDGTIKIWNFHSSFAKFTIDAHARGLNCVDYFVGYDNKLYIFSSSVDEPVKVWDYESKSLIVQSLEGNSSSYVKTILVHPKLPIIITGWTDKTIRIWNKNTHRFGLEWSCDLGEVLSMGFNKSSNEVVLGCEDGMVVIKIINTSTSNWMFSYQNVVRKALSLYTHQKI